MSSSQQQQYQQIQSSTRNARMAEVVRCGKDPKYFMNAFVKIQHPMRGSLPFSTYPFQDDCIDAFQKHRFNIVVKSRQLGLSTVTAAYALWYALFRRDKNVLVIATQLRTARNFIRKVRYAYESLPPWLCIASVAGSKDEVTFSNGSAIKAVPTSEDAGRSEALSLLVVDEAAHIYDFESIWTGIYPTISTGGAAILISTPNGVGNQYHTLYSDAVAGVNEFNCIELPWHVHPEHDQAWYDKEVRNMSKRQVAQEMLCDFVTSGDTFMQADELLRIRDNVKMPMSKEFTDRGVWIWRRQTEGTKYLLTADVARGDSNDCSTFHITDLSLGDVVCEYKGKIPPDKMGELIDTYGRLYNVAVVCPENNGFGYTTCMKLKELKYPNLWYESKAKNGSYTSDDSRILKTDTRDDELPGFTTTQKNRSLIVAKLEEMLRNGSMRSYSQRLFDELRTFMWVGSKPQAMKGKNDDLVMSLAINCWLYDTMGQVVQTNVAGPGLLLNHVISAKKEATSVIDPAALGNFVGLPLPYTNRRAPIKTSPNRFGSPYDYQQYAWVIR